MYIGRKMAEAFPLIDLYEEARHIQNFVASQSLDKIVSLLERNINDPKRMKKVIFLLLAEEFGVNVAPNMCQKVSKSSQTYNQADKETENCHTQDSRHGCSTKIAWEVQPGPSSMVTDKAESSKSKGINEECVEEQIVADGLKVIDSIVIVDDVPELATNDQKSKYVKTLKDMFPDIDLVYLTALCESAYQNAEWLDETITQLLHGEYVRAVNVAVPPVNPEMNIEPPSEDSLKAIIDKNYIKFLEILPDADPTYLRDAAERCGNDEKAVTTLVTELFETRNYPTYKDYLSRQKTIGIQRKYIDCFNVEEFLEIFPDPIKYFSDKVRHDGEPNDYDLTYLKSRYRSIRLESLRECYHKYGRNLTRACKALDKHKCNMKRLRRDHEIKYPEEMNISFIQEIAFIENQELINTFLKQKLLERQTAIEEAKQNGDFLECSCCFDEEVLRQDIVACNEGHLFCKPCVQKYVETCIGDGKTSFPCLTSCNVEFNLQTLKGVLKASVFSRLLQKKQSEEVNAAGIPGLENCPFCDFAMIPAQDDKIFRCLNGECMKHSCRNCKTEDHIPLRCEEVEKSDEIKMRTFIEDKMTEALVRICWNCKRKFIKEDGCNKMTCICGAFMCYLCRQPVLDYKHFNGQGGTEYDKCPLYSNNNEIHLKAVIKEGKKAKALALSENPDVKLKHDPTHSFPKATTSKRTEHVARHNNAQIQRKRRHDDA